MEVFLTHPFAFLIFRGGNGVEERQPSNMTTGWCCCPLSISCRAVDEVCDALGIRDIVQE